MEDKFVVTLEISVDSEANFYDSTRAHKAEDVSDVISNTIYDLDDIQIKTITVEEQDV